MKKTCLGLVVFLLCTIVIGALAAGCSTSYTTDCPGCSGRAGYTVYSRFKCTNHVNRTLVSTSQCPYVLNCTVKTYEYDHFIKCTVSGCGYGGGAHNIEDAIDVVHTGCNAR
jgi:hypothetical protein